MSKNIRVFEFSEGRGMYTKGTRNFDEAVIAMRGYAMHEQALDPLAWADNSNQSYDPKTVTKETVKEMRYWTCKDCGVSTIGDENICFECNDPIQGVGRLTFAFFAD